MIFSAPLVAALVAAANPQASYRLQGDALVLTRAPSGVIALSGRSQVEPWLSAEALVWAGAGDGAEFEALVVSIQARTLDGRFVLRAGRLLGAGGALRPTHFDGVTLIARAPWGTQVEAFGGVPVSPRQAYRGGDWLVGGRVSQAIGTYGRFGLSIAHQTDESQIANQEVAADLAFHPGQVLDLSARAAYDLVSPGLSEVVAAGGVTVGSLRLSVRGTHRSPARILPATSVFSVLGDIPSQAALATIEWRAAPRLDVSATAGARHVDGWGEDLSLSARLRFDDRGRGALGVRLSKMQVDGDGWMGARATLRVPLIETLLLASEAEIARTEAGDLWPWALVSLRWAFFDSWVAAAALEASASPIYQYAVQGLGRLSYVWSGP